MRFSGFWRFKKKINLLNERVSMSHQQVLLLTAIIQVFYNDIFKKYRWIDGVRNQIIQFSFYYKCINWKLTS